MLLHVLALALASPDPANPSWMVGTWGWQNAGERGADCGSDHTVTYYRDGTYDFLGETGKWRIDGNRLIETVTGSAGPAGGSKSTVIRFKRTKAGVLEVAGEYPGKLIKCPAE